MLVALPLAHASPPSLATMKAALEKGDLDEASRQGVLAGTAIVEAALASPDRAIVLAGITAAPRVEARAELLEPLAKIARGPDRRTAIPATRAAVQIARELSQQDVTDDIADADIVAWRDHFSEIAIDRARWIEVRVLAVDAAAYLERSRHVAGASTSSSASPGSPGSGSAPAGSASDPPQFDPARADVLGVPWSVAIVDPDPAFRRAVLAHVPSPTPIAMRDPLAKIVVADADALVALAATAALCADLAFDPPNAILPVLGEAGIKRVQSIVMTEGASRGHLREAARCLAADKSKESAAALRAIRNRTR
jgi:hypothetical protein